MKYGYMNYRKHLLVNKNDRPMNLGDPIQSFAVLNIYKRLGISEEDIIPLDRYDLADYAGDEVIVLINGAENYEYFCYATRFLPVSDKIHPVFISIHFHRDLSESELETLRGNQPIGCRDEYTANYLKQKGIDAFLSGCLTMTFPKRDENKLYEKVFIVDCPKSILEHIPEEIKDNAEYLSQIIRLKTQSADHRLSLEETQCYNDLAMEQLMRYRDEAKLVITTRLHVASPCAAMGIPVVLVRDTFDERYQFIDRFLQLFYPEDLDKLDWKNIKSAIPESVKDTLQDACKNMLDMAATRIKLHQIYENKEQKIIFANEETVAAQKFPMNHDDSFDYCIWGVCMPNSYLLYEQMQKQYPKSRMRYAIDTYATGIYKDNIRIIHPTEIDTLINEKTWILVVAPAAHNDAKKVLSGKFSFILIRGAEVQIVENTKIALN